ncbi:MAG TPA: hypothetical protein DCM28_18560 [Phycisphaerales bacterium]|nr:hypothetical protein [Phycisphaerales bacterium]HCD33169.1 hypothetical protein [Phycisphaerales bacterium]|tara:strand:- start:502 stop:1140 length:639 start_codon:yes stop_codon:yes gene_type:complete
MKQSNTLKRLTLTLACIGALLLTGCRTAEVTTSLTNQYPGSDMDSQMNFWHSLNDKKLISNDEALHGAILFYCSEDHAKSYDERVYRFKQDKFLAANFDGLENEAITRGQLASILARMLKIKGGVMMQLFGPQPRYALKEMVALRIFPESSAQQVLNGAQFIEIMGRAEDYQLNADRKASAEKLNAAKESDDQNKQSDTTSTTPAEPEKTTE